MYANEADLLNVALFGITAKQWREANPKTDGNIRDEATLEQLVVLSNLESINSVLINQGLAQPERLTHLNQIAITQMKSLLAYKKLKIQPIFVDNETFPLQAVGEKSSFKVSF